MSGGAADGWGRLPLTPGWFRGGGPAVSRRPDCRGGTVMAGTVDDAMVATLRTGCAGSTGFPSTR
jgi:hypothetical protein